MTSLRTGASLDDKILNNNDLHGRLDALWAPRPALGDPRLRLAAAAIATVLLLALSPGPALFLALTLSGAAIVAGGPALGKFLRLAAGIGAITLVLNAFTTPGAALLELGPFAVTAAGIAAGAARAARLVGLAAVARLVAVGIGADDLAALAPRLTWPLERRIPALCGVGLALGLAVRFAPEIPRAAARIRLAQAARPPRPVARGLGARRAALESFYLPLLGAVLRRADEVARTLDARGFASGAATRRSEDRWGRSEAAIALALAVGAGLALLLDRRVRAGG